MGYAPIGDALGQPLQQLGKAVEAVVARAERIHVGAGAGIQQLLERPLRLKLPVQNVQGGPSG